MKLRNVRIAVEIGVVLLHHSQCFFETISNEHLCAHFAKLSVWKMTFLARLFACTRLSTLAGYCTKLLSEMNNVTDLDFADVLRDLNFWKPKILGYAYRTYLVRACCEENEVTYSFTVLHTLVV